MKKYLLSGITLFFLGCEKHSNCCGPDDYKLPGGKGEKFNIAVFPSIGMKGISGKVYIKYGSDRIPQSFMYDDSSATMTEPGFGPHAHFFSLASGYYAIAAKGLNSGNSVWGDTLIQIKDTQSISVDFKLYMR